MGNWLSNSPDSGFSDKRVLMFGLDAVGKTTILYRLKLGKVVGTIPTPGFNVEEVRCGSDTFTVWDMGGGDRIRSLYVNYYEEASGLIFVVGSNDIQRIRDAREMLYDPSMLAHPLLAGKPLLVLANKLDLPLATSSATVAAELELHNLTNEWHVQGCSAYNGDGLDEGLKWLATTMKRHI